MVRESDAVWVLFFLVCLFPGAYNGHDDDHLDAAEAQRYKMVKTWNLEIISIV